jgi:hypothetical protein
LSVYVKAANGNRIAKLSGFGNGASGVCFDLVNEIYQINSTWESAGMKKLSDGWFRIWSVIKPKSTGKAIFGLNKTLSGFNYTGDGVSSLLYWGGQLEKASSVGPYTPTTTAAASIPALHYTFPATNIDPTNAELNFGLNVTGVNGTVLDIGGTAILEEINGNLVAGGNASVPVTPGTHDISLVMKSSTISISVDGAAAVEGAYTPPIAGLITVSRSVFKLINNK